MFSEARRPWLWPGLLAGPAVLLVQLSLAYALVPLACDVQRHGLLDLVAATALLTALGCALASWRDWALLGRGWSSPRTVLALAGLALSALAALVIVAQWAARLAISPCLV